MKMIDQEEYLRMSILREYIKTVKHGNNKYDYAKHTVVENLRQRKSDHARNQESSGGEIKKHPTYGVKL